MLVGEISIERLEQAINRAKSAFPSQDSVLSADVLALGDIYGLMIYHRARVLDVSSMGEAAKDALNRWAV